MKRLFAGALCAMLLATGCAPRAAEPVVRNAITLKKVYHLPMPVYLPSLAGYHCPIRYQPPVKAGGSRYDPWQITIYCTGRNPKDLVMITEYGAEITPLGKKVEIAGTTWETSSDGPSYVMTMFGPKVSVNVGGKLVTSRVAVVLLGTPSESLAFLEKFAASLKRTRV